MPHQLLAHVPTSWLPYGATVGAAFPERKEGGGRNCCDPALWSTRYCSESSPAWHCGSFRVCSAVKKWRLGDTSNKPSILPVAPGHSWERAAATALAQPWDIYVPPQLGSQSLAFLSFPLRKHPWKGNERVPMACSGRS